MTVIINLDERRKTPLSVVRYARAAWPKDEATDTHPIDAARKKEREASWDYIITAKKAQPKTASTAMVDWLVNSGRTYGWEWTRDRLLQMLAFVQMKIDMKKGI